MVILINFINAESVKLNISLANGILRVINLSINS